MRTTLDLDGELIEALMSRFPGRSKTEAIQEAISAYLAETAAEEIKRLAGAMEIEDVSTKLRRIDRHT